MASTTEMQRVRIADIRPYENNAKIHGREQLEKLKASIKEFGFVNPCLIDREYNLIAGHGRVMAATELGMESVPCVFVEGLTDAQRRAYILTDNKLAELADWDNATLAQELADLQLDDFDITLTGFEIDIEKDSRATGSSLIDVFGVPPYSILDTRQGYWQDRKKAWKELGIQSELGRDDNLSGAPDMPEYATFGFRGVAPQTSIFDPVICEIVYKWFCPDGGSVYDCFAGGSVRGIVAEKLGYKYVGIELRQEQVDANRGNAESLRCFPTYICDDSRNADEHIADESVDLLFSCPPYGDLETYSDDPRDISNMEYDDFLTAYREIVGIACRKVKKDRFAVFVVGDIRDGRGFYRNFIDETKKAFNENGFLTYNELILIEQSGTAAMRANRQFNAMRKVVKTHQNVLVFYKGDPSAIKENYGELTEFGEVDDD